MKIIIEIPEKTIAHIRSDYGHGIKGLKDEDREIVCDAIYSGTNLITCEDCAFYQAPVKYSYKETTLYCCRSAITKVSEDDYCSKAVRRLKED